MQDIVHNTVFIIHPYRPQYQDAVELAIKPAIEENGYRPILANGEDVGSDIIHTDIRDKIYYAKLCIADLSRKYDDNGELIDRGNVIHEATAAQAIGRHVILLCHNPEEDLPYDMRHIRSVVYQADDLLSLKQNLSDAIRLKLKKDPERLFKQVEFMTQEVEKELKYLREESKKITVTAYPPISDIFFNDKLLGPSPQTFYVNPNAHRNTISVASPAYLEEHIVLTKKMYKKGKVHISLTQANKNNAMDDMRIYSWVSNRRTDPNNPVLMRAVAQFFARMAKKSKEAGNMKDYRAYRENAQNELDELLRVAPGWYMAHNQIGVFHAEKFKVSLGHYKIATALNPDSYLGYFNQACAYARKGEKKEIYYEKTLEIIASFLNNKKVLESYSYSSMNLEYESAFEEIRKNKKYKKRFYTIVNEVNKAAKKLIKKRAR